jgi:outer membrane protein assembly factor BamB
VSLALVLVGLLVVPPGAATWAQENADPANRGHLDRAGPSSLEDETFTGVDDRVLTQIVEGPAGLALAASLGGTVYAIDAGGDVVWQVDVGDEIRTAPLWTGEHVVVLPRGDRAHAFTAHGEPAWTVDVANDRPATLVRMASPVEHASGDVILATMAGNVHRVTPNGTLAWTTEIGTTEAVEATPAITADGDVVAAAFEPGRDGHGLLARLDGADGAKAWEREIGAQVVAAPTVVADRVLVPLRDGNALEARSLNDGTQRWETAFDASITASPSLHEGKAIAGDIRGNLRALEISGGREVWSFHPFADDPEVDPAQRVTYTIADSAAVDGNDVVWAPYWVADLSSNCCPPEDSTDSPFYRLDAEDGEILDRETHPKANHGPAILASGVWTGSDEHGVRAWSHQPSLQIHAEGATGEARWLVNTDRSGAWQIAWDGEVVREGETDPPATGATELAPGEHTLRVTVGDATARAQVTVEGQTQGDEESEPAPEPSSNGSDADGEEPEDPEPAEPDRSTEEPTSAPVPAGIVAAVVALLVASGVRRRA